MEQLRHDVLENARAQTCTQIEDLAAEVEAIVESTLDVALDDEHDPDGSTVGFERAWVQALLDQARARLAAIEEAIDAGTEQMPSCADCGSPIAAERLEALPTTRVCVRCAVAGPGRRIHR